MQVSNQITAVLNDDFVSNDYHILPTTEKQLHFARQIAKMIGADVPQTALSDRRALSAWIDKHHQKPAPSRFSRYPSSKQVAYAERIARLKRRPVPTECFRDRSKMSSWIDSNV